MTQEPVKRSWPRILASIAGIFVVLLIITGLVAQRLSDGPTGPIQGGELRTGSLVTEPVGDWSTIVKEFASIELQLVEPMGSRITGAFVYDGELYIPCDLGFVWSRTTGRARLILHVIYILKGWHEDVLLDGRVVLRIEGKRYERQAVRVTDPMLIATFRSQVEQAAAAAGFIDASQTVADGDYSDIWFFRMDPRSGA